MDETDDNREVKQKDRVDGGIPLSQIMIWRELIREILPDSEEKGRFVKQNSMLLLGEIFPASICPADSAQRPVSSVAIDSNCVEQGAIFVALSGLHTDGHAYVLAAAQRGAVGAVVAHFCPDLPADFPQWIVADPAAQLGALCAQIYGTERATDLFTLCGVTGTDGKTTTAALLTHLLESPERPCGTIGTLGLHYPGHQPHHAKFTTPPAPLLHEILQRMRTAGCQQAVMEISSQSIPQHRIVGLRYAALLLTHVAVDHLDYHGSVAAYAQAKAQAWKQLRPEGWSILSGSDPLSWILAKTYPQHKTAFVWPDWSHPLAQEAWSSHPADPRQVEDRLAQKQATFGEDWGTWAKQAWQAISQTERDRAARQELWKQTPQAWVRQWTRSSRGLNAEILLRLPDMPPESYSLQLPLFGEYNLSNALSAWLCALLLKKDIASDAILRKAWSEHLLNRLRDFPGLPGRQEIFEGANGSSVVVDFAHTPGAIRALLTELRHHLKPNASLWTLCNASGDRDREKRPMIAAAAAELADRVILTLEETGKEDPRQILQELADGLGDSPFACIPFRPAAIRYAIDRLQPGDILVVPSLGDQTTIRVGTESIPYDERNYVRQCLANRRWADQLSAFFSEGKLDGIRLENGFRDPFRMGEHA